MASHILNELFAVSVSETECEVQPYSERLERVVDSCHEAHVVRESQQWSRIAAIQHPDGAATIYEDTDFDGDELPFNPAETSQWIAYYWDRDAEQHDIAWVAVWPIEDEEASEDEESDEEA